MLPFSAIPSGSLRTDRKHTYAARASIGSFVVFAGIALPAFADAGSGGSFANIDQIADIMARSDARLVGTGNAVEITQEGRNLVVDAYIEGQMNRATSQANSISQTGKNATATVSVTGDMNTFSVRQSSSSDAGGGVGRNDAALVIDGSSNDALIQQTNDFGELFFNSAALTQTGHNNSASIYQTVSPTDVDAGGNVASVQQTGNDNDALIEQRGADNTASIDQDGSYNQGQIQQDGEGLSAALVQTGTALEYTIKQTGCVIGTGCGTVVVTQGAH